MNRRSFFSTCSAVAASLALPFCRDRSPHGELPPPLLLRKGHTDVEVQYVSLIADPTGGTVTFRTGDDELSVPYNATPEQFQAAIDSLGSPFVLVKTAVR